MNIVFAGQPTHTFFRSFEDPEKAQSWAQTLLRRSVTAVYVDGKRFTTDTWTRKRATSAEEGRCPAQRRSKAT